jgi:hypothetical protein
MSNYPLSFIGIPWHRESAADPAISQLGDPSDEARDTSGYGTVRMGDLPQVEEGYLDNNG